MGPGNSWEVLDIPGISWKILENSGREVRFTNHFYANHSCYHSIQGSFQMALAMVARPQSSIEVAPNGSRDGSTATILDRRRKPQSSIGVALNGSCDGSKATILDRRRSTWGHARSVGTLAGTMCGGTYAQFSQ